MHELTLHDASMPRGPESVHYAARPGIRALPEGTGIWLWFGLLQIIPFGGFLWAIWWPAPISTGEHVFAIGVTAAIVGLVLLVFREVVRRHRGYLLGLLFSPFVRIVVSDRRVYWTVPWRRTPLMEIGAERVQGGIGGLVDARGRGSAAIVLAPGDWAAGGDGCIHIDRLPDVAGFVRALGRMT